MGKALPALFAGISGSRAKTLVDDKENVPRRKDGYLVPDEGGTLYGSCHYH